ncbi:DUF350 domain-containing protein [soil metagenome]
MPPEMQAFANGFPVALLQALITLVILLAGVAVHGLLSPYKEVDHIREGNAAAAVSFGGVVLGLALPLSRSLTASTSAIETAIWGVAATVVTLLLFRVIDMLLKGLPQRVQEGEVSAAALVVAAKLAVALVLGAAFSG